MYIGKLKDNNLIVIFEEKDIVINALEFLSIATTDGSLKATPFPLT